MNKINFVKKIKNKQNGLFTMNNMIKNLTHPPQGRERDKIKQYAEMEGEELLNNFEIVFSFLTLILNISSFIIS